MKQSGKKEHDMKASLSSVAVSLILAVSFFQAQAQVAAQKGKARCGRVAQRWGTWKSRRVAGELRHLVPQLRSPLRPQQNSLEHPAWAAPAGQETSRTDRDRRRVRMVLVMQ